MPIAILGWFQHVLRLSSAQANAPRDFIRKEQRKYPPKYDRFGKRVAELRRRLPQEVDELFRDGKLAMGEVGILRPDAYASPLTKYGYAIEFHSGLKRLIYDVARALGGATVQLSSTSKEKPKPLIDIDEFAQIVAAVFTSLKITLEPIALRHRIDKNGLKFAEALASESEYFLMMHEVAHVWFAHESPGNAKTLLKGYESSERGEFPDRFAEEFAADYIAMQWSLSSCRPDHPQPRPNIRMVYAGAELGLRIYQFLEHVGFNLEESHPSATERLNVLRIETNMMCQKSNVPFEPIRTIAVACDAYLQAAENVLKGKGYQVKLTSEQLRVTLVAICEECLRGNLHLEAAKNDVKEIAQNVTHDEFVAAVAAVREVLKMTKPLAIPILDQIL
jgi:hypothetical protein